MRSDCKKPRGNCRCVEERLPGMGRVAGLEVTFLAAKPPNMVSIHERSERVELEWAEWGGEKTRSGFALCVSPQRERGVDVCPLLALRANNKMQSNRSIAERKTTTGQFTASGTAAGWRV